MTNVTPIAFSIFCSNCRSSGIPFRIIIQTTKKVGTTPNSGYYSNIKKKYLTRNCIKSGTFSGVDNGIVCISASCSTMAVLLAFIHIRTGCVCKPRDSPTA